MDEVVVIPAYEPDERLPRLLRSLRPRFRSFVVVDDGSRGAAAVFAEAASLDGVVLLRHDVNRGKGVALKTAFDEILRRFPDASGVVTADADGQHLAEDIGAVADAMCAHPDRLTLGVRRFGTGVPLRSRFGNLWSCAEFFLLTGVRVLDTQTGLRGIPLAILPRVRELPGERYEYEAAMLRFAAKALPAPVQVPIATVYEEGNKTSHFRPLRDSVRTQLAWFGSARMVKKEDKGVKS